MGVDQHTPHSEAPSLCAAGGRAAPWVLFLIAICARIVPFSHVFSSGKVYFYDPDCYIRLRKIHIYLQSFPSTWVYDYFEAFPRGTGVISPPTMEYIVAALAYPFRSYPQLSGVLAVVVAVIPVVIGAISVVVLYFLMCRIGSRSSAVIACLVLALYPPFVEATILGRFDNEMMEPLLLLSTFWLYISTYGDEAKSVRWHALGLVSVLYLSIWRGAVFPLAIIGVDLLVRIISHRHDKRGAPVLGRSGARMYLTSAALVAAICALDLWGTGSVFSYNVLSWFHVLLFSTGAGLVYLTGEAAAVRKGQARKALSSAVYAALAILIVLCMVFLARNLIRGIQVVAGGNAWVDSISQYQTGFQGARFFTEYYGLLTLLAPLTLLICRSYVKERLAWSRFLLLWTVIMAGAVFLRARFAEYLGLNVALLAGIAVSALRESCKRWGVIPHKLALPGAMVVLVLLQAPTFRFFQNAYQSGCSFNIKGDFEDAFVWLDQNTPSAGDPYRPFVKPRYGVLARWDFGGWIESISRRPVLATSFGTETYGMEEVARFMLAGNENEMDAVLEKNEIRYVVVDKVTGDLPLYARLLGREDSFFSEQWDPGRQTTVYLPNPYAFSLVASRLFFADGSLRSVGKVTFFPVEGMRLVYESASPASVIGFPWEVKKIKIFERVKGVSVAVHMRAGGEVTLAEPVETNQCRSFVYLNRKLTPRDGLVRFTIPYAMKKESSATGATGPVVITCGKRRRELSITESDIVSGKTITLSL